MAKLAMVSNFLILEEEDINNAPLIMEGIKKIPSVSSNSGNPEENKK